MITQHLLRSRLLAAISTTPSVESIAISASIIALTGAVGLPYGLQSGFLQCPHEEKENLDCSAIITDEMIKSTTKTSNVTLSLGILARIFITPALAEEILFRCLPLPHPTENMQFRQVLPIAIASCAVFVLYHPLAGRTVFRGKRLGDVALQDGRFLVLASLMGLACTSCYLVTGSLWVPVFVHWGFVAVWQFALGGNEMVKGTKQHSSKK